jgi:predicted extracellular nuclease
MIGAIAGSARRMARLESVLTSLLMMAVSAVTQAQTTVFINELHYDNSGSDTGEAVEIAGPAGADLTGWSVELYNGSNGLVYDTVNLSGTIPDQDNGFGTLSFPRAGIQNGAPDGLALVDPAFTVVQFLSYEGTFKANDGPAAGITSADIGVVESSDTAVGNSLQLTGFGTVFEDFDFAGPSADSFGDVNAGQDFSTAGGVTPISQIQGATHTSPFNGLAVTTTGVVTAVDPNGFYLQDPVGDGDPATSEGIFVFTGSEPPTVTPGDEVSVEGVVSEFQPGGESTNNLTITEIVSPEFTVEGSGKPLPAPVILGVSGRVPPTEVIEDDDFTSFDPAADGIDFYEAVEGMLVTVEDAIVVGPTNGFGEIFTFAGGTFPSGLSERGTLNISPDDFNPERIQIDRDSILSPTSSPEVNVGDSLGDVTGVVSYSFGNYEVLATQAFAPAAEGLQPERTRLCRGRGNATVASFNVLNLDPNDSDGDTDVADGRFDAVAAIIVKNLRLPDIVALQEVQDNDGSDNTAVTAADVTLQELVDAIRAINAVDYAFIDNPFIGDDTSGGQPGGNIRTAFLYNPKRVGLVPGSVATVTDPADQQTNPENPFYESRLPLVATFSFKPTSRRLTVINNHFSSKGGSSPLFGMVQPATFLQEDPSVNGGVGERRAQANALNDYVGGILDRRPRARIVVLGDFNEFEFVSPLEILEQNLYNLTKKLPGDERYTFIFEGNSQSFDHILVSPRLQRQAAIDIVHVNAEFASIPSRASDHDPVVTRLGMW